MKHSIKPSRGGLEIDISKVSDKQEQLLAEFEACREGRCSCATNEYEKLDSLEIAARPGNIGLRLKAKTGRVFDSGEIEKCLDHIASKLSPDK